jgi:hypothetical protein
LFDFLVQKKSRGAKASMAKPVAGKQLRCNINSIKVGMGQAIGSVVSSITGLRQLQGQNILHRNYAPKKP